MIEVYENLLKMVDVLEEKAKKSDKAHEELFEYNKKFKKVDTAYGVAKREFDEGNIPEKDLDELMETATDLYFKRLFAEHYASRLLREFDVLKYRLLVEINKNAQLDSIEKIKHELKEMKAWWPSADTGAYTCMNLDCSDEEYIKNNGKGRTLQYPQEEER